VIVVAACCVAAATTPRTIYALGEGYVGSGIAAFLIKKVRQQNLIWPLHISLFNDEVEGGGLTALVVQNPFKQSGLFQVGSVQLSRQYNGPL
jgi:hypothetical protein